MTLALSRSPHSSSTKKLASCWFADSATFDEQVPRDTCEAHNSVSADCDSAATKLVQFSSSPSPEFVPSLEQNQTLLIAILQTWYLRAWQQPLLCQEESLDKLPNFRCKNPPLGLLSQHDFEGRRKDSSRHTQFVLPHISWEVFWHTFQRNKVIKGESTFPGARHTSFIVIEMTVFCLFSEFELRVRCLVWGHYANKFQPHEIMAFLHPIPNAFENGVFNPFSVHS